MGNAMYSVSYVCRREDLNKSPWMTGIVNLEGLERLLESLMQLGDRDVEKFVNELVRTGTAKYVVPETLTTYGYSILAHNFGSENPSPYTM